MDLRYDGGKRDVPPPAGSIAVLPAGSSVLWRRRGRVDALHILLEPSLVARVAAESFEFDSTRTVVPPLDGLTVRELRSAMLAVESALRAVNTRTRTDLRSGRTLKLSRVISNLIWKEKI